MGRKKRIDVRKKRKKLIQKRKKDLDLPEKEAPKSEKDEETEIKLEKETKLYWSRAVTGALSALIGRLLFGLVGWLMFFWMLGFWFGFPFLVSFFILKYEYDEEEWNWKNIIKPGIGIFFFLFMIMGTLSHTLLKFY